MNLITIALLILTINSSFASEESFWRVTITSTQREMWGMKLVTYMQMKDNFCTTIAPGMFGSEIYTSKCHFNEEVLVMEDLDAKFCEARQNKIQSIGISKKRKIYTVDKNWLGNYSLTLENDPEVKTVMTKISQKKFLKVITKKGCSI